MIAWKTGPAHGVRPEGIFSRSRAQPKSRPRPLACEATHRIKDAGYRRKPERAFERSIKLLQALDIPLKKAVLPSGGGYNPELSGIFRAIDARDYTTKGYSSAPVFTEELFLLYHSMEGGAWL